MAADLAHRCAAGFRAAVSGGVQGGVDNVLKVAALALLVSACAPHPKLVPTPCISKDRALPAEPDRVGDKLTGNAGEDVKTLAGGLIRWQAYGRGMREIVESCRG